MSEELLVERREGIVHVTLNRPQARNALTFGMYEGLAKLAAEASADDSVRAVILTGISPQANGHVYNQENLARFHKDMDQKALQALRDRRYPIFTADPDVAESSGIPLWSGEGWQSAT